jgi:hypothetical protein
VAVHAENSTTAAVQWRCGCNSGCNAIAARVTDASLAAGDPVGPRGPGPGEGGSGCVDREVGRYTRRDAGRRGMAQTGCGRDGDGAG